MGFVGLSALDLQVFSSCWSTLSVTVEEQEILPPTVNLRFVMNDEFVSLPCNHQRIHSYNIFTALFVRKRIYYFYVSYYDSVFDHFFIKLRIMSGNEPSVLHGHVRRRKCDESMHFLSF